MSSLHLAVEFDINGTLGALSIGALVSTFLFGISTLQVYMYFVHFPEDRWTYKSLVSVVWLFELGHCICVCHFVYIWTIARYGDPSALDSRPPMSISTTIILAAFIGPPVQMFFAERVRVVSEGRMAIPVICWLASGAVFGIEMFLYVKAVRTDTLLAFESDCRWLIMTALSMNAAIDTLEAFSLCYYLRELESRSLNRTSAKIHAMMRLTMETGLLKSMSELSVFLAFWFMPHNFIWLALYICLTRLHSNSLLAALNSRTFKRAESYTKEDVERPPIFGTALTKVEQYSARESTTFVSGSASTLVDTGAKNWHPQDQPHPQRNFVPKF